MSRPPPAIRSEAASMAGTMVVKAAATAYDTVGSAEVIRIASSPALRVSRFANRGSLASVASRPRSSAVWLIDFLDFGDQKHHGDRRPAGCAPRRAERRWHRARPWSTVPR